MKQMFFLWLLFALPLYAQQSNVTISTDITSGGRWSYYTEFNSLYTFIPTSNNANVNVADLATRLRSFSSNMTITTACATCTQAGNINFNAALTTYNEKGISYNRTLTLQAAGNVNISSPISLGYPFSTDINGGTLNFSAVAGANIFATAAISTKPMDYASTSTLPPTSSMEGGVTLSAADGFVYVSAPITTSGAASPTWATLFTGSAGTIRIIGKTGVSINAALVAKGRDQAPSDGFIWITGSNSVVTTGGINDGVTAPVYGGYFYKDGPGVLLLSALNTYTGSTVIAEGTIRLGSGTSIPDESMVEFAYLGGTLDLNGFSETIYSLEGGYGLGKVTSSVPGNVTLTTGNWKDTPIYHGIIEDGAGVVSLTKQGTGTFSLGSVDSNLPNTYSGITTVNAGILAIYNNQSLGNTVGGTVINGSAQLQPLNNLTVPEELTLNSSVPGLYLGSGQTIWTGVIKLASTSTIKVENGASLTLNPSSGIAISSVGVSLFWDGQGARTVNGAINLGTGGQTTQYGILTLTAGSNYSGTTLINLYGIINARHNTCLGTGLVYVYLSGILQLQGGVTIANDLKLFGDGNTLGALRSVNGQNVCSGSTLIYYTTGQINADLSSSLQLNGAITLGTNSLKIAGQGNVFLNGVLSGTGKSMTWGTSPNQVTGLTNLIKLGTGTLRLSGQNTFSGFSVISDGVLQLGESEVLANNASLILNGGKFDDGGYSETMSDLYVLANGKITMGSSAHSLIFSRLLNYVSPTTLTIEATDVTALTTGLTIFGSLVSSSSNFVSSFGSLQSTIEGGMGVFGNKLYSQIGSANSPLHFYINSSLTSAQLALTQFYHTAGARYYTVLQKPVVSPGGEILFSTPK